MRNNLLKKFLSFSIGGYVALVIGFFTTPITTRMLSPEQYGISSMYLLVVNILILLAMLGLDQGFVRYFYDETEEDKGLLLKNCLKIPVVMLAMISILILLFREKISKFIFLEDSYPMIILLIVMLIFTLLNRYSFLTVRMNQKAKLFSMFQILTQLFNFIFIVLLFKVYGDNYKTIIIGSTITTIILTLFSIFSERKIWSFKGKNIKTTEKELLKYSLPFTITMALTWIFQSSDKVVIKMFSNVEELGLYAAAFKIVALLNIIQGGFTTFWIPVAYERYTKNPKDLEFFEKIHSYMSLVMFGVALVVLMSKDLIILLLGEKFRVASSIMPCLVLMPIMYTISETTVLGINFKKRTKYHMNISVVVAVLNILGNLLLVPYLEAKGAAISTGLVYVVFFSLRTYFSLKEIKFRFNLKRFYFSTAIIMSYAIYLTFNDVGKSGILLGILFIMAILIIYFNVIKEILLIIKSMFKDRKNFVKQE
ncbi:oligosaccharide flippase family protein [Cetobacterium sp.]|uniref:oligosaccharide flippase family protein n=1 Tax=Cetobacterium sp. TaxID=2071632 RepID=UPI003F3C1802